LRVILRVMNQNWREARITIISSAFCAGAYALLIPRYRVFGAVWATLLTFTVMMVLSYMEAQSVSHFHFEFGRLGKLVVSAAAALILNTVWNANGMLAQLAVATLSTAVYLGLMTVLGFLEPGEKQYLVQLWRRWRPATT
jgi:O-antigen/teichoic acid export membrane protein